MAAATDQVVRDALVAAAKAVDRARERLRREAPDEAPPGKAERLRAGDRREHGVDGAASRATGPGRDAPAGIRERLTRVKLSVRAGSVP